MTAYQKGYCLDGYKIAAQHVVPNSDGEIEQGKTSRILTLRRVAGTKLLKIGTFGEGSARRDSLPTQRYVTPVRGPSDTSARQPEDMQEHACPLIHALKPLSQSALLQKSITLSVGFLSRFQSVCVDVRMCVCMCVHVYVYVCTCVYVCTYV